MVLFTDRTFEFNPKDIKENKWLPALSYLGILVFIPMLAVKNSKFSNFHVTQGLNLSIFSIFYLVLFVLVFILGYAINAVIGKIFIILMVIVGVLLFAMAVFGIVNALTGKARTLPLIGTMPVFNLE